MNKISYKKYDLKKDQRRSIRLKEYDYSQAGAYFVTICVKNKRPILGSIVKDKIVLSTIGKIVYEYWKQIPDNFDSVKLDMFTIMPNHCHGILFLNVGARFIVPKNKTGFDKSNPYIKNNPMALNQTTLGKIIRFFKAKTTHQIRNHTNFQHFQWQRNYYEHIIRNEAKLKLIREYTLNNPRQWQYDRENPECVQDKICDLFADLKRYGYGESSR